ncbi:carbamoyl-phosphate synthase L chain, ATP binding domain-containing protein [Ditylenchus destructor]|nr:carbamoyl-phosphate synthase L chain, ATP binding domain-containing protein [Ditylenchus destructor]
MGIRSVAVYSDADRHALHVKRADEAHSIGAEPLAGYLNPRKLVNLAGPGGPVTPGTEGNVADIHEALTEGDRIGYPGMLKATSGGGGRGIRRCNSREELEQAFPRVISEAKGPLVRGSVPGKVHRQSQAHRGADPR